MNLCSAPQRSRSKSSGITSNSIVSANGTFGCSSDAMRWEAFLRLQFRSHQIVSVHQFALRELGTEISIGSLEMAFDCPLTPVKKAMRNGPEPPKPCGRHSLIQDNSEAETEADIIAWIQYQAEKCQPSTRADIFHYCACKFGKVITRGWVDSFVIGHNDYLAETTSKPHEDLCLQIPREFLLGTMRGMEEAVQTCVCDLVLTWTKSESRSRNGKTANRRRLSCRLPWVVRRFTMELTGI
jgi:hypothetical protein